jgi:hypothetical protein
VIRVSVPTWKISSIVGFRTSGFFWVVRKIFLSPPMAWESALMDFSLPTKIEVVTKGKRTISLRGTSGRALLSFSGPSSGLKKREILIMDD